MVLAFTALALCEFDFSRIGGGKAEQKTVNVIGTYKNIDVNDKCADITVVRSEYTDYRVKGYEKLGLKTEVIGNKETSTLEIFVFDTRKWFEKAFANDGDRKITVYLPAKEYDAMKINTVSGDVSIDGKLNIDTVKVNSTSGNVSVKSAVPSLLVSTVSGDIEVYGEGYGSIDLKTTSGDVKLSGAKSNMLTAETTSGDLLLKEVTSKDSIKVKTTSGNVTFDYAQSSSMTVDAVSGNVNAKVAGVSNFDAHTTSGKVIVPTNTVGGGTFKVTTVSGNINISYFGQ